MGWPKGVPRAEETKKKLRNSKSLKKLVKESWANDKERRKNASERWTGNKNPKYGKPPYIVKKHKPNVIPEIDDKQFRSNDKVEFEEDFYECLKGRKSIKIPKLEEV